MCYHAEFPCSLSPDIRVDDQVLKSTVKINVLLSKYGSLTFPLCDAVWRDGSTDMNHAAAVGHFILAGVFTRVVIIY